MKPIFFTFIFLLITSCAVKQIHYGQLFHLNKGVDQTKIEKKIGSKPLHSSFSKSNGREFTFDVYNLNNGVQYDTYILSYEDGLLIYWGYVSEFKRLNDSDLVEALNIVLPELLSKQREENMKSISGSQ